MQNIYFVNHPITAGRAAIVIPVGGASGAMAGIRAKILIQVFSLEHVTVLSGRFHAGMGEKLDKAKGLELLPGAFVAIPPGMAHFAWARKRSSSSTAMAHGGSPMSIPQPTRGKPTEATAKGNGWRQAKALAASMRASLRPKRKSLVRTRPRQGPWDRTGLTRKGGFRPL